MDNFFTLVPDGDGLAKARIQYVFKKPNVFELKSDRTLPTLSIRLGPYGEVAAKRAAEGGDRPEGSTGRVEQSGHANGGDAWWVWVEG